MTSASLPVTLRGRRVLVVDDDDDTRELMAELLVDAGAEVRTAADSNGALLELTAFAPDVVVCDVCMPGEDGYALIRRIRELPADRFGRVAAAALTGFARPEDRARSLAAGFDLHVSKPFDAAELVLALSRLADAATK